MGHLFAGERGPHLSGDPDLLVRALRWSCSSIQFQTSCEGESVLFMGNPELSWKDHGVCNVQLPEFSFGCNK